ncbi:HAD family hydrolase [Glycomyces xiaoerkulensis]|uniref:HAD family hydrolase n=1 Tax=Glycomyces xiaoerkulensis TaxID=2038139 RepID=UPI00130007E7|nr:HAD family hydrolase [Glycomyces xiaoerkulensis]
MLAPAVIASDLDGTLLNDERTPSERTRKALAAAAEGGLAVVAVTARTPYGVDTLPELHPLVDSFICANGAIFYRPVDGRMRIRRSIPPRVARRVSERVAAALPEAVFAVETGTGIIGEGPYRDLAGSPHWRFVDSLEAVFTEAATVVKVKVFDPGRSGEEMAAALDGVELGGLDMCHWGEFGMLDFNAPGANKASGLETWCAERGFGPDRVVAFGDMPNDVPMLAWAGRSYAMEGAHPEAIAAATGLAASNEDDGVARIVEELLDRTRGAA